MEKTELELQVKKVVEDLFSEKEEAKIRENTEQELQKAATTVANLTSELETKNTEVSTLQEQLEASETRVQELTTELEAAGTELETSKEKLAEVEKSAAELQETVDNMNKDRVEEARMKELEDAGVANTDRETQSVKVREMTDDEFASYKGELVSIREAVITELEKAREKAEADAKAEEEAARNKAAEEAEDKEEAKENSDEASEEASEEEIAPAQITPGHAAMASLNLEHLPDSDLMAKYAELGKAMASRWKKSD
jgi:colicin import membrane protein